MYANFGFFRNKVLKAIQIGGGTPTDIDTKLIVRLIDTVKAYFGTSQCELLEWREMQQLFRTLIL